MSIKTDGATWKRFYTYPGIWTCDCVRHKDVAISFNGLEDNGGEDYYEVADDAFVELRSGTIVRPGHGDEEPEERDILTVFREWQKGQQPRFMLIEISADQYDKVRGWLQAANIRVTASS